MAKSKTRRRQRGAAWYWKQTDAWYYTPPGTKDRKALVDEKGRRVRGKHSKPTADLALARIKANGRWRLPPSDAASEQWLVAKVCSLQVQRVEAASTRGDATREYSDEARRYLNSFCEYCGRVSVNELRKGHVELWVESNPTWRSSATQRNAFTHVMMAFNFAEEEYGIQNPLRGLKKPPQCPRLHSISPEDETAMYAATDRHFKNFLFAAVHTGLRPFCELARLTADDIEESPHGMLWRVYSTKTKKTRKIPVRREIAALVRKLRKELPSGSGAPLFRNPQGNPWKKVTGVGRFLAIKRRLKWTSDPERSHYSSYSCRHTFAHRMLSGYWNNGEGCSIETLAELMGDTPKVTYDHYGREWARHYHDPLWAAIGVE